MKIICEKGYHAGNVLRLVAEYLGNDIRMI